MTWILAILSFICSFVAIMSTGLFILSCISAIINPQITVENGAIIDKNRNSRYMFLIISAIAWGLVIAFSII